MKKFMLAAAFAACISPAVFAGDKVDVEYGGIKKRFDAGDLKAASVCSLKQMVASEFGLKANKFDLMEDSHKLNEDKTLYAADVREYNKLWVKEVSSSSQC